MAEEKINIVVAMKDAASSVASTIRKNLGSLGKTAIDVGKTALKALAGAAVGLGGALIYATKQAAAEEVGIKRLETALKANVKGWNGNRASIEKVIAAREKLAFSDDELRDSLSKLVTRTKDVTKAQNLQAIAMNLARLRGIDLATASDIIGKVYSGNTGILSRYGIQVKKGATATEALAEIQKQAAGQAEAYGKSTAGAWESFRNAVGNLVEDVGTRFLPIATAIATTLRDQVVPAVSGAIDSFGEWIDQNRPLIDQIANFVSSVLGAFVRTVRDDVIPRVGDLISNLADLAVAAFGPGSVGEAVGKLVGKLVDLGTKIAANVLGAISDLWTWLKSDGRLQQGLAQVGEKIKAMTAAGERFIEWIQKPESRAARAALVGFLLTLATTEAVDTTLKLAEALKHVITRVTTLNTATLLPLLLKNLAVFAALSAVIALNWDKFKQAFPDIAKGMEDIRTAIQKAGKPLGDFWDSIKNALRAIGGLIDMVLRAATKLLEALVRAARIIPTLSLPRIPGMAHGGRLPAGRTVLVGEKGPELFRPNVSGTIIPNHRLSAATAGGAMGGGGSVVLNFNSIWPPTPEQAREIAKVIDRELSYSVRSQPR